MNAINPPPIVPEDAPFSALQRAWLNGFLAGLFGGEAAQSTAAPVAEAPDYPWHDPALEMTERMELAAGRPLPQRLMAAMAQLDCGQCGYLCETYSQAIAEGREATLTLCVPGAKPTNRMLKQLLAETPPAAALATASGPARPVLLPVRVLSAETLTKPASAKDVRHVVIDLAASGLVYEPGDSIGLATPNDPTRWMRASPPSARPEPRRCHVPTASRVLCTRRSRRISTSCAHSIARSTCWR
jgi:sulfite reductase (NADPH) flavoprotein alpha-component